MAIFWRKPLLILCFVFMFFSGVVYFSSIDCKYLLIFLFAALCLSTAWTAVIAGDKRGRIFALGVATLIFAHVYINMGMCIGLVPITGLPLPFLSLGRTFLITIMCALGIVQSISLHREDEK